MQIEVVNTLDRFEHLADEWNTLLSQSAIHVPFLRHEYLLTWWRHMGGGEWKHGELYILIGRNSSGNLVGAAPFFYTTNLSGIQALMLIGSIEISDYLDVIATDEHMESFWETILKHITSTDAPDWRVLDFYNIIASSPTVNILEQLPGQYNWSFQKEVYQPSPMITLPNDWQTYLSSLNKRDRKNIDRRMRLADNYHVPVTMYAVEDEDLLDDELDDFFDMMVQDPAKKAFLSNQMREQMRATAHTALDAGWLQLFFLQVGNRKVAAQFNFDYNNRIWAYNSALNFNALQLSPGLVLSAKSIQWAIENGREAFDFMRGDESYKYTFGATDRHVLRLQITRN
jgi:CelD/BcsL family acetyltransferase involved in cellulose biosynthesis